MEERRGNRRHKHDDIAAVERCIDLYNNLGVKDRGIIGLAIASNLPREEIEKLESNPRTDFMKAYYELSDRDRGLVAFAMFFSPMNAKLVLEKETFQPSEEEMK